jgi:hypothetical protein
LGKVIWCVSLGSYAGQLVGVFVAIILLILRKVREDMMEGEFMGAVEAS